jgi:predicted AlkP superfamily pyrophosphatase or phosphodiesterase
MILHIKSLIYRKHTFMYKTAITNLIRILAHAFVLSLLVACSHKPIEPAVSDKATVKHIVLISVDGLRPDAINSKNAKNLYALSHAGLYYANAQTIKRSVTLPSHTSMLTGLDVKQHKITNNNTLPGYIAYPTVMQILKKKGKTTATLFSKKKLKFLFPPDSYDHLYGRGQNGVDYHQTNASKMAAEFSRFWGKQGYNLTFIHLREPDSAGHKHGWMSDEYLNQAIPTVDDAIGQIYDSIKKSPYANDTLLIITSDHGGQDTTHWHHRPEDLTIPWMAIHPAISSELNTDSNVNIYDTTPTILYLMNAPAPEGLDGQVIQRIKTIFAGSAN